MQKENNDFFQFPNLGIIISQLPDDIFYELKKEIKKIKRDIDNQPKLVGKLAGHIENSYDLINCKNSLENYILNKVLEYDREFKYLDSINNLNSNLPLVLESLWVNFQKKCEFNPNHNHSGVISFVIWIEIPYDIKEEISSGYGKNSTMNLSSAFQFTYCDILGNITNYPIYVDKSYEGKIIIFPNKLVHCVYPFFSSDEYRISVAGNITINAKDLNGK
jgi:hypothetical protein